MTGKVLSRIRLPSGFFEYLVAIDAKGIVFMRVSQGSFVFADNGEDVSGYHPEWIDTAISAIEFHTARRLRLEIVLVAIALAAFAAPWLAFVLKAVH